VAHPVSMVMPGMNIGKVRVGVFDRLVRVGMWLLTVPVGLGDKFDNTRVLIISYLDEATCGH
jgi:hypothetical protein